MKFSVIIPLYNKAPYVVKAVESVLAQTYRDYELIIVDDGSTDGSAEVALQAISGQDNCRLIRQENAGVSVARNNGVSVSHGDYLCFLDADDWWEPSFLEEMSDLLDQYPDAGIYGTSYRVVDNTNHKTRLAVIGVEVGFERGYINYFQAYAKTMYMPLWTGAVCIPRTVFDEVGGFKPILKMSEDFDLWVRIAIKYKVALLNKPLSNYNQDVDAKNRAIGTLPTPDTQFAFCADYLKEVKIQNPELKYVVEMVQIACLRNYYLSYNYHNQAKSVLKTLEVSAHKKNPYADYLNAPLAWVLVKDKLFNLLKKWKEMLSMLFM